eukprot:TRINITY_DN25431_c0_g1_i1.p1 TRINITY_DN25431_c0_g1~~TRINITY_DN25431_c0_g1_i1.p1  ORF type:complete len:241 (+),score=34.47 TRINITY_DN25431_c0_g1_i1:51-773(+)
MAALLTHHRDLNFCAKRAGKKGIMVQDVPHEVNLNDLSDSIVTHEIHIVSKDGYCKNKVLILSPRDLNVASIEIPKADIKKFLWDRYKLSVTPKEIILNKPKETKPTSVVMVQIVGIEEPLIAEDQLSLVHYFNAACRVTVTRYTAAASKAKNFSGVMRVPNICAMYLKLATDDEALAIANFINPALNGVRWVQPSTNKQCFLYSLQRSPKRDVYLANQVAPNDVNGHDDLGAYGFFYSW